MEQASNEGFQVISGQSATSLLGKFHSVPECQGIELLRGISYEFTWVDARMGLHSQRQGMVLGEALGVTAL